MGDFEVYYNDCRRHMTLGGALAAVIDRGGQWSKPEKSAKTLPAKVEQLVFADASVTAYRLAA